MPWDVMGGVARRAWARNDHALETTIAYNETRENDHITLPYLTNEDLIADLVDRAYKHYKK
jgi:urocanate hydratase